LHLLSSSSKQATFALLYSTAFVAHPLFLAVFFLFFGQMEKLSRNAEENGRGDDAEYFTAPIRGERESFPLNPLFVWLSFSMAETFR
jgi:hypothetical protein